MDDLEGINGVRNEEYLSYGQGKMDTEKSKILVLGGPVNECVII